MSDDRRSIALNALRAAGHDQAAELVAAIIPEAVAPTVETVGQSAAEIPGAPAEPSPEQAHLAALAAAGVPVPGQRLTSEGMEALAKDIPAWAAYEDAPGGVDELRRVMSEESKGRRVV
ncbi:MAG TPA: hypothetical protein VGN08_13590 [Solirubrobacteraceae bacterium]|jgi:hypothetical protein